jgi:hypothetical protein
MVEGKEKKENDYSFYGVIADGADLRLRVPQRQKLAGVVGPKGLLFSFFF